LITKLSPKQVARIPEFIDKWSNIGLSIDPVDHGLVESHVKKAYLDAGKLEPKTCAWFKSPLLGALAYLMLMELGNAHDASCEEFGKSLKLSATSPNLANLEKLKASVNREIFSTLTRDMADIVNTRVHNLVDAKICDTVLANLPSASAGGAWESVIERLESQVDEINWTTIRRRAMDNLPSLATMVFRQGLGIETPIDVRCLCDYLSEACGLTEFAAGSGGTVSVVWWWPFEKICVLTERYTELHRDEHFMLHNEIGPSVKYPDGWSIYCHHGAVVEPWVVTDPGKVTPQTILGERNPLTRGVLLALYGEHRFSRDTGIQLLPLNQYPEWASSGPVGEKLRIAGFIGRGSPRPLYLIRQSDLS
jgi:hypothetical protein